MNKTIESDADVSKSEGHGSHWTAAVPNRDDNTVEELLRWVCKNGKIAGEAEFDFRFKNGSTRPEKAYGILHPDTPLRYLLLVISDSSRGKGQNEVASGYPYCMDGGINRIRVDQITTWSNCVEGIVHGTMRGGQNVNFFDVDYFKNHAIYQTGKAYDFSIAGLAYKLCKATQNKMVITEGPALDLERERVLGKDPAADISKITSVELSLEHLRFLVCDDKVVDDAEFRTIVDEVGYFEVADIGYYRIRAILTGPNDCDFPGYIYVTEAVLQGYRPQKGDSIEGCLWLQGRLVSETAHDSVPEIEHAELEAGRYFAMEKAEATLAGQPFSVIAVGRTLAQWGGEIQTCESEEKAAPAFLFTHNQETWEVWVCCQMVSGKTTESFSASKQERLSKSAASLSHRAAFVTVKCKDLGQGYRIKMEGLDELKAFTGGGATVGYIKKPDPK